ncbi:MAG: rRNA pseudouridine synthase [Mollicutes bacterium]|nr:rRNA pseudouridine synthase [Mollicutes bacterium]
MERLQKVIAASGYTSRRKAEELISKGKVMVNNEIVTELGYKVNSKDEIIIEGLKLEKEEFEYYLFNKPRGVITTTKDEKGRKTVMDFFESNKRLYPVGRLDYDTTGALLITNDGEFANLMSHPSQMVNKIYLAKLEGIINGEAINKIKDGIKIDGSMIYPSRVKLKRKDKKTNTSFVEIIVHDGKNHEIKKIFEAVGYRVEKLTREAYGPFCLETLKSGESRKISAYDIKKIKNELKRND